MDLGIVGIIDIVIIVLLILSIIVGAKKGFVNSLSGIGVLLIVIFSVLYCGQLANLFKSWGLLHPDIYEVVFGKIEPNLSSTFTDTLSKAYNIPFWIAGILAFLMGKPSDNQTAMQYSEIVTIKSLTFICFFIMLFTLLIALFILKLISKQTSKDGIGRAVDRVFGVIFSLIVFSVFVCVVFWVLKLIYNGVSPDSGYVEFMNKDLMLNDDSKFRISKIIYNGNILASFMESIFW